MLGTVTWERFTTQLGSTVKTANRRSMVVDFDWFEEGGCIECAADPDAIRDFNFTKLIWSCPECGGGSVNLMPVNHEVIL